MSEIKTVSGDLLARDMRIALVASRFNEFVVDSLIKGAVDCLERHGAMRNDMEIFRVPGAFELPLAVDRVGKTRRYDGIVALGAVIRGSTPHFDYVAGECVRGTSAVSREQGLPVGFGILTVDTIEQAIERSGTKAGNKGEEAALAVIEMISLLRRID